MILVPHRRKHFTSIPDPYTVFLCHCDGADGGTTFTDSAKSGSAPHTISVTGSVHTETDQVMYGTASAQMNNGSLSFGTSADWNFGYGDWTVEMWVRLGNIGNTISLSDNRYSGGSGWTLLWDGSNGLYCKAEDGAVSMGGTTGVTVDNWAHIAAERYGQRLSVYTAGTVRGTNASYFPTPTTVTYYDGALALRSGAYYGFPAQACYVDEIRITKGLARYYTIAPFTPSGPFNP